MPSNGPTFGPPPRELLEADPNQVVKLLCSKFSQLIDRVAQAEDAFETASKRADQMRQKVQESAERHQALRLSDGCRSMGVLNGETRGEMDLAWHFCLVAKGCARLCKHCWLLGATTSQMQSSLRTQLAEAEAAQLRLKEARANADFAAGEVLRAKEAAHSLNEECERLSSQCREEQRSLEEP
eukprot:s1805_g18.t1